MMLVRISRFFACAMWLMFLIGCAPASVLPTVTPSPLATSTSIITPTTTSIPLTVTSQPLTFYFPKVEKRCPENREVSVDKLGIDADSRIILSDLNQTGLWSLNSVNPMPQLIQELPLGKWKNISINPNGKILAYLIWNPDNSSSTWLYDLENKVQREILNIKYWEGLAPGVRWLSDQELLINNVLYQSFPLYVVDVYTGDLKDMSDVDSKPYDDYQAFYADGERYYALYSVGNIGDDYIDFYAFDYLTYQKTQVFSWLQDRIFFYPYIGTNLGMEFDLSKIFMMVEQSYGFDVGVVDDSIEALTQDVSYDSLMKRVFTDSSFGDLSFSFARINPSSENLFLSMNYKDYVSGAESVDFSAEIKTVEDAFFVLNLVRPVINPRINYLVFTDYCFATTGYYVNEISPDGKIVILNSMEDIVLLNLETGYITYLPNWSFIGWAK